ADGKRIATTDHAGLIRLWDAQTLRPLTDPGGHRNSIQFAELSADGKRLLTWDFEAARVWDLGTGKELRAFATPRDPKKRYMGVGRPPFRRDGGAVVCGDTDGLIARDILTGLETPLPGAMAELPPGGAVFAPDGKAVITYPYTADSLSVWDWPSGKQRFT